MARKNPPTYTPARYSFHPEARQVWIDMNVRSAWVERIKAAAQERDINPSWMLERILDWAMYGRGWISGDTDDPPRREFVRTTRPPTRDEFESGAVLRRRPKWRIHPILIRRFREESDRLGVAMSVYFDFILESYFRKSPNPPTTEERNGA